MPKSLMIRPEEVRGSGQVTFDPIPINQYNRTLTEELDRFARVDLIRIHRDMAYIRGFETMLNEVKLKSSYQGIQYDHRGPAHLSIGQEASAVGQAYLLGIDDHIFGSHRSHGEILAKGLSAIEKLDTHGLPPQAFLGVAGMPGLTAYSGLLEIGAPKPGETVFVSGGAGAVGSVVAQIAKIKGCTVIATAGSAEKCNWLRSAGVDYAINYKDGDLLAAVRAAAPKGVDVYFDNVGGEHLEIAMEVANPFARFAECGMISQYNATAAVPGPRNMIMIVGKRLNIRGFIVSDFAHLRDQFLTDMGGWIAEGRIKWEETVMDGIAAAPDAFLGLFSGGNTGKMVVKL